MQAFLYVFAVLFGLVIGSFLNVVIYRVPRNESLVRPGSHCPKCGDAIRWYDNIPVISWLLLRGRCRSCRDSISPRYPLVELFVGASFGLCLYRFDFTWYVLVAWLFVAVLVCLALIDLDRMVIPTVIALPAAAIGLGAVIALDPGQWWVHVASAAGAATFCFLLAVLWPGGGMGGGDVTMALLVGGVLGFPSVLVAFFLAFLAGTIVGLYLILVLKKSRKTRIPFGPFLAAGSYVALFLGEAIVDNYLDLFR